MMKKFSIIFIPFLIFLILCSIQTYAVTEGEEEPETESVIEEKIVEGDSYTKWKPWKAGLLSLACPGGGQYYNRKYLKATIMLLIEGALVYNFLKYDKLAAQEYKKHKFYIEYGEQELSNRYYYRYTDYFDRSNYYLFAASFLWAGSSIDAFMDSFKHVEAENDPTIEGISAWKTGMRSLILPGWGQFYNGKYFKGTMFFLLEVCLIYGYMDSERDADKDLRIYNEYIVSYYQAIADGDSDLAQELLEKAEPYNEKYDEDFYKMRSFATFAIFTWAMTGIDAYIDAHFKLSPEKRKKIREEDDKKSGAKVGITLNPFQPENLINIYILI